jgi:RHS repeat-associated protein
VAGSYTYTPYGQLASSTGTVTTPLGYAGQYVDPATGLQYLQARWYDPATASFLTVDPASGATHTAYAYASNNPTNETDPTGQRAVCDNSDSGNNLYQLGADASDTNCLSAADSCWNAGMAGPGSATANWCQAEADAGNPTQAAVLGAVSNAAEWLADNSADLSAVAVGGACVVASAGACLVAIEIGALAGEIGPAKDLLAGGSFASFVCESLPNLVFSGGGIAIGEALQKGSDLALASGTQLFPSSAVAKGVNGLLAAPGAVMGGVHLFAGGGCC